MSDDRREEPRTPVQLRVRLRHDDLEAWREAQAGNLSPSGIFLSGVAPRADGTLIRFELLLASGAPALRGEGAVVWSRGGGPAPGLALRFTRLDGRSKQRLDEWSQSGRIRNGSIPPPRSTYMPDAPRASIAPSIVVTVPRAAAVPAFRVAGDALDLATFDRQLDALARGLALAATSQVRRIALASIDDTLERLASELPLRGARAMTRSGVRLASTKPSA